MKKCTAIFAVVMMMALCACAWAEVAINPENFPDETFGTYLAQNFDTDGDEILSNTEIAAVERISVADSGIKSLEGIRYFTRLKELHCEGNSIETLDIHGLTELAYVYCQENSSMVSLNVSGCTALKELHCAENSIASLNITGCNNLEVLNARENAITGTIDLHGITTLSRLNIRTNYITSIDVHGCTALTELYARDNQLQELNVTGCNALEYLSCGTQDSSGPEHTNHIKTLDLSGKTKLLELWCSGNDLTALDLTDCTALTNMGCGRNEIATLNLSGKSGLKELWCSRNQLTALDISDCTDLISFDCGGNNIGTLDVSKNTKLVHLEAYACRLERINLSNNTELEYLDLGSYYNDRETRNKIATLDLSNNTKLKTLECDNNDLTALDVSKLTQLERLVVSVNNLTTLDVSKNTALTYLVCRDNDLTALDLSANTALTTLRCQDNDITTLDLSHNPLLSDVTLGTTDEYVIAKLRLTYSPNASMPYSTDMKYYTGSNYTRITSVKGYNSAGDEILTSFITDGTASFVERPAKVIYTYNTGYTGTADIDTEMKVVLVPDPENPTENRTNSGTRSSSSGCNSLSGAMILAGLAGLFTAKKH